jgi:hypothetical protein
MEYVAIDAAMRAIRATDASARHHDAAKKT